MNVFQLVGCNALAQLCEEELQTLDELVGLVFLQEGFGHRGTQVGHKAVLELTLESLEETSCGPGRLLLWPCTAAAPEQLISQARAHGEGSRRWALPRCGSLVSFSTVVAAGSVVWAIVAHAADDAHALRHGGLTHGEARSSCFSSLLLSCLLLQFPSRRLLGSLCFACRGQPFLLFHTCLLFCKGLCSCFGGFLLLLGLSSCLNSLLLFLSGLCLSLLGDLRISLIKSFFDRSKEVGCTFDLVVHLLRHFFGLQQRCSSRGWPCLLPDRLLDLDGGVCLINPSVGSSAGSTEHSSGAAEFLVELIVFLEARVEIHARGQATGLFNVHGRSELLLQRMLLVARHHQRGDGDRVRVSLHVDRQWSIRRFVSLCTSRTSLHVNHWRRAASALCQRSSGTSLHIICRQLVTRV
mmetsp:Transcript_86779/g.201916  ORF Transcript_86779/g.201916 Transcript_86779/m.201916 type:complete len:410 (+) Transcript_86779:751-1980(+)